LHFLDELRRQKHNDDAFKMALAGVKPDKIPQYTSLVEGQDIADNWESRLSAHSVVRRAPSVDGKD